MSKLTSTYTLKRNNRLWNCKCCNTALPKGRYSITVNTTYSDRGPSYTKICKVCAQERLSEYHYSKICAGESMCIDHKCDLPRKKKAAAFYSYAEGTSFKVPKAYVHTHIDASTPTPPPRSRSELRRKLLDKINLKKYTH